MLPEKKMTKNFGRNLKKLNYWDFHLMLEC